MSYDPEVLRLYQALRRRLLERYRYELSLRNELTQQSPWGVQLYGSPYLRTRLQEVVRYQTEMRAALTLSTRKMQLAKLRSIQKRLG